MKATERHHNKGPSWTSHLRENCFENTASCFKTIQRWCVCCRSIKPAWGRLRQKTDGSGKSSIRSQKTPLRKEPRFEYYYWRRKFPSQHFMKLWNVVNLLVLQPWWSTPWGTKTNLTTWDLLIRSLEGCHMRPYLFLTTWAMCYISMKSSFTSTEKTNEGSMVPNKWCRKEKPKASISSGGLCSYPKLQALCMTTSKRVASTGKSVFSCFFLWYQSGDSLVIVPLEPSKESHRRWMEISIVRRLLTAYTALFVQIFQSQINLISSSNMIVLYQT